MIDELPRIYSDIAYRKDMRTRKAAAFFNMELGEASTWDFNNYRYLDAFITTSSSEEDTESEEEEDNDE